jgi:uncharacterized membrane protein YGL010W
MRRTIVQGFMDELRKQRWDDHRYYHHSRINQALHLVSACTFVFAYVMVFVDPVVAVLAGWLVAMTTRQAGHFFFEPRGYDHVNEATDAHKEDIKVGYNIQRKIVLMSAAGLAPLLLLLDPGLWGLLEPRDGLAGFAHNTAVMWIALAVIGLLARTVQLFFIRDVRTGLAWAAKIVTDPFHDIMLYHKAPAALLRGELIDPGEEKRAA